MTKISIDELDAILLKQGAIVTKPVAAQAESSDDTGEHGEQFRDKPLLRKPIDAAIGAATTIGAGAASTAAGLSKIKINLPLRSTTEES